MRDDRSLQNPKEITRILFEDFPGWAIGLFCLIGFTSIGSLLYGWYVRFRKYSRGRPVAKLLPLLAGRLRQMVTALATHNTPGRRDRPAGLAHALIFFGFGTLFIGTATITLDDDILQPLFGVAFWDPACPADLRKAPPGDPSALVRRWLAANPQVGAEALIALRHNPAGPLRAEAARHAPLAWHEDAWVRRWLARNPGGAARRRP